MVQRESEDFVYISAMRFGIMLLDFMCLKWLDRKLLVLYELKKKIKKKIWDLEVLSI